jgi:hypothetical protein
VTLRKIAVLIFSAPYFVRAAPPDLNWRFEATRLTGASEKISRTAARRLKTWPALEKELRAALDGEDRYLAVDVIGALRFEPLREDLIRFSARDEAGFSYIALGAFIDGASAPGFVKLFAERLQSPRTSPPAKVILLDTLSRMGVMLNRDRLAGLLLNDPSPEVKSAALSYLRARLLKHRDDEDLELLRAVLGDPHLSPQRRIQARFIVSELDRARAARLCPPECR